MSPQRRQTRATGASCAKSDFVALRRRPSNQSKTLPVTPVKTKVKPSFESPAKKKMSPVSRQGPSPLKKIVAKCSSPRKSPQKAVMKSPEKSSKRVKASPTKQLPKSHSKGGGAAKKALQSPSKNTACSERISKPSPKTNVLKDSVALSSGSPRSVRSTRSSSAPKSPVILSTRASKVSPSKTPNRLMKSPTNQVVRETPPLNSSARKRLLTSPARAPQSPRGKRLKAIACLKKESDAEEDCIVLDEVKEDFKVEMKPKSEENIVSAPSHSVAFHNLPTNKSDPKEVETELSGRFLRRKWFSLKARGGFTCLRSAILTPEEVANVVLQHTMVDTPREEDANFFSTKLMMRLSSRLPPSRARPSCEELVDLINLKQTAKTVEPPKETKEAKGEGTAIRVKLERRSFSDTISHLSSKPHPPVVSPASPVKSGRADTRKSPVTRQADGTLTKKQEREIALRQLKNLSQL